MFVGGCMNAIVSNAFQLGPVDSVFRDVVMFMSDVTRVCSVAGF